MLLSFLQSVCTNCTKALIAAGRIFITILFNIKKYCVLNMVAMVKKQEAKMRKIRRMHSLHIWRRMVCYFIPAICSPKDIRTVHLLHFMDHGIAHLNHKKVISLRSFHLKMESQAVNGKYLLIILPEEIMFNQARQNIVPVV